MAIFLSKKSLELDNLEVEVIGRVAEANRLIQIIGGMQHGLLPKVISVHGPTGSGKTLISRKVVDYYEKKLGGVFKCTYVNLGESKTVYSCANRLLVALGEAGV